MKNLAGLMKQAAQMQTRMKEAQAELEKLRVEAESGSGLVKVILTGKGDLENITIDPKACDPEDVEMLQDLVLEAFKKGREEVRTRSDAEMKKVTGGMSLPGGMELPSF